MALRTIVSYDDTDNDQDALALGQLFSRAGAALTLAYVRHTTQDEHVREELDQQEAEALLERGARRLDDPYLEQRVVVSGSTGEGLKWLAEQDRADLIIFGSEYRTAIGHVTAGRSAQTLLEGGTTAVALAPAGYYREIGNAIRRISILAEPGDHAPTETAQGLAYEFDAALTRDQRDIDLLVVGSRSEAPNGRVMITSQAQRMIDDATYPVIVLARGVPLSFSAALAAA